MSGRNEKKAGLRDDIIAMLPQRSEKNTLVVQDRSLHKIAI